MADLEANFMHLQLLNESLGRFNENFGAFLYGLNMSAFCVDFPEVRFHPRALAVYVADDVALSGTDPSIFHAPQRHAFSIARFAIPRP